MTRFRGKRGTTCLFLAIILSALILVEVTYLQLVLELDRKLTYDRGVRLALETYLADYNRQLFDVYGLYAFDVEGIDDEVYRSVLAASGISEDSILVVSGMDTFDEDDLQRAINIYCTYRSSGMLFSFFGDQIVDLLEKIDDLGILESLSDFMSSDAATVFKDILDGASEVADTLGSLADLAGLDDISSEIADFNSVFDSLRETFDSPPDIDGGFDITDDGFLDSCVEEISEVFSDQGDDALWIVSHTYLCSYAAFNFDSMIEGDTSLNGTPFTEIHSENSSDLEYILTGLEGTSGELICSGLIYRLLLLDSLVEVYLNPDSRSFINGAAEVMKLLVDILTLGMVDIPKEAYKVLIVFSIALRVAALKLITVLNGNKVTMLSWTGTDVLEAGYRDILSTYMFYIPDDMLLSRMLTVLSRDYPGHVTGVALEASAMGTVFSHEGSYELYE